MTDARVDVAVANVQGRSLALVLSYHLDFPNPEVDGLVRDLCKLPYDPVEMVWERPLRRGTVHETCVLVTLGWHGAQDVLRLAARHGMDAVVTWSHKDGLAVFRDTTNGRDFVAWDARDDFDLEECRSVVWDHLGPRFRSIGDPDDSTLREVHRHDSELPDRVHPYRLERIRREMFGHR